ncbi:MAG: hypothetical protein WA137_03845 [Methanothrix sp.]
MAVERYSGPTPSGAAYWDIIYLDNERNPVSKAKATMFNIYEYDNQGILICSTHGFFRD